MTAVDGLLTRHDGRRYERAEVTTPTSVNLNSTVELLNCNEVARCSISSNILDLDLAGLVGDDAMDVNRPVMWCLADNGLGASPRRVESSEAELSMFLALNGLLLACKGWENGGWLVGLG